MTGLLYGSPKTKDSTSMRLINRLKKSLGDEETMVISALRKEYEKLDDCDCMVIVFPLYVDALPAHLLQFLVTYSQISQGRPKLVYALCHCGFYEGPQCRPALDIIRHFCTKSGFTFGGGAGLGAGFMLDSGTLPPAAEADLRQAADVLTAAIKKKVLLSSPVFAHIGMPRFIYIMCANMMWKKEARQNGLSVKDLSRKGV